MAERVERPRQPFANTAGGDELVHLLDEPRRASGAELRDADVLAVGVAFVHDLVDGDDEPLAHVYLHFFVGIPFTCAPRTHEKRVVVPRGEQIGQELLVKQHVAVDDHEAVGQPIAR